MPVLSVRSVCLIVDRAVFGCRSPHPMKYRRAEQRGWRPWTDVAPSATVAGRKRDLLFEVLLLVGWSAMGSAGHRPK